jgi:hypothetical protein
VNKTIEAKIMDSQCLQAQLKNLKKVKVNKKEKLLVILTIIKLKRVIKAASRTGPVPINIGARISKRARSII